MFTNLIKQLKFYIESYWFGIASDDMQIIKAANYNQVDELLSRYQGEQCKILIIKTLPEYAGRSILDYTVSLLSNEVKEMLRDDKQTPKAIDVPTVSDSGHKVSDVMRTFIQVYGHCDTHAREILEERFEKISVEGMIKHKLVNEWRGDENPGLNVIAKFIKDLAHSYTQIENKYHIDMKGYKIMHMNDNHYRLLAASDEAHAIFDITDDGTVETPLLG